MDMRREQPATVREIADHFTVTQRTVRRWMVRGLEHAQVGGKIFTTWEAVARFATDRHTPAAAVITPSADYRRLLAKHGRTTA
jgi:hypothetical protein